MLKSSIFALISTLLLAPLYHALPLSGSDQTFIPQAEAVPEVLVAGVGTRGMYDKMYNRFFGGRLWRPEMTYFYDPDFINMKDRRSPMIDEAEFRMLQAMDGSRKPRYIRFGKRGFGKREWDGRLIQALESVRKPRFGKRSSEASFANGALLQAMESVRKPRFGKRSNPILKLNSLDRQIFP